MKITNEVTEINWLYHEKKIPSKFLKKFNDCLNMTDCTRIPVGKYIICTAWKVSKYGQEKIP